MIVFDFDIAVTQSCEDRILEDIDCMFCTLSNELRKQERTAWHCLCSVAELKEPRRHAPCEAEVQGILLEDRKVPHTA